MKGSLILLAGLVPVVLLLVAVALPRLLRLWVHVPPGKALVIIAGKSRTVKGPARTFVLPCIHETRWLSFEAVPLAFVTNVSDKNRCHFLVQGTAVVAVGQDDFLHTKALMLLWEEDMSTMLSRLLDDALVHTMRESAFHFDLTQTAPEEMAEVFTSVLECTTHKLGLDVLSVGFGSIVAADPEVEIKCQ